MRRHRLLVGLVAAAILMGGAANALTGGRRALLGGKSVPRITLSNASVASVATVGTTIGTLSVVNGKGAYTFTFSSNPGTLFSISAALLQVAAALSAGADPIIIHADNGAGSVLNGPFTITVTPPATNGPMDFSVAGNIAATAALW